MMIKVTKIIHTFKINLYYLSIRVPLTENHLDSGILGAQFAKSSTKIILSEILDWWKNKNIESDFYLYLDF